jgi:CheY-like chemotaxis protein
LSAQRQLQTVLYVDDDPDIRQIARAALELVSGYIVHLADGGASAIELARRVRPDVILLDVMMPGLDGPATLRQLRADPVLSELPVIFITAKVMPIEIAQFRHLGVMAVIAKPFDPLTLGAEVRAKWTSAAPTTTFRSSPAADGLVQVQVGEIANRFLARTKGDALRLRELLGRAQRWDADLVADMERLAHSIHGGGAVFGFAHISASAGMIEGLIGGLRVNGAETGSPVDTNALGTVTAIAMKLLKEIEDAMDGGVDRLHTGVCRNVR